MLVHSEALSRGMVFFKDEYIILCKYFKIDNNVGLISPQRGAVVRGKIMKNDIGILTNRANSVQEYVASDGFRYEKKLGYHARTWDRKAKLPLISINLAIIQIPIFVKARWIMEVGMTTFIVSRYIIPSPSTIIAIPKPYERYDVDFVNVLNTYEKIYGTLKWRIENIEIFYTHDSI